MSQCDAVVVAVSGDQVWVEVPSRAPACGNCKTPEACQESLLRLRNGQRRYQLENHIGARVGDHVKLTVAEGTLWSASLATYVVPVLLAIAGATIGQSVADDPGAVLGLLAGLCVGVLLLRIGELRARQENSPYQLQIQCSSVRFKE